MTKYPFFIIQKNHYNLVKSWNDTTEPIKKWNLLQMKKKTSKNFTSLKKLDAYFADRLFKVVNNSVDRVKLPCPYSRASELFFIGRALPDSERELLNDLLDRYEILQKRIRTENSDLKGIINRQSRELVNGRSTNVKVLYEGEIYFLKLAITEANFQIEKYQKDIQKIMDAYKDAREDEEAALKREQRFVTQLATSCDIIEAQIVSMENRIDYETRKLREEESHGNQNNDNSNSDNFNSLDNFENNNEEEYNPNDNQNENVIENENDDEYERNRLNDLLLSKQMALLANGDPAKQKALSDLAALKSLPALIRDVFERVIS
ncbi:hypothetical protein TRFO_36288 [Tritrichomonas foetus]|uniref:Uncharacterized protein n=1 Tax=Tritrichomonas foetus TaxID=1144522 RepID=A0A1J4JIW6_9EUKA|nr:hypothetical protein TRFO_36288 [Tritrichomonas foetus]|eukprot:OHS97499.1 hypothetical protein TRFO_36288 [Tritrichomonas foetus]